MSNLNINFFNLIIISGVVYGVIFSFFVINQKKKIKGTIYLALAVLFLSLSNLQYWMFDTGYINQHVILRYIYFPWHWLIAPSFFIYVSDFIGSKKLNFKNKLPLIAPFFTILLLHILQLCYKFFINSHYIILSSFERGFYAYMDVLSVIFTIVIIFYIYKMILNYEKDKADSLKWAKSETNWLKRLIYLGVIICFVWFVTLTVVLIFKLNRMYLFYPMWVLISVLVYWIGHTGLNKSEQLKKQIELSRKKADTHFSKKNSKSFMLIKQIIEDKRLYLNPLLSLSTISEELNLSESYISKLVKDNTKGTFTNYVNNFRVEVAKTMLKDKEFQHYNVEIIGLESGFNSRTSFFTTFKKSTSMTPNQYRKLYK